MDSNMIWQRLWAWTRACVIIFVFSSCKAWHSGEPTAYIANPHFHNPDATINNSGYNHYQKISLWARAQQFVQDNVRISGSHAVPAYHRQQCNPPIEHADFARALAHSSQEYITWFFDQQMQIGAMTQDQVLCLYKLYSNPNFLAYIKKLPGYDEHILSVYARLIDPAHNRKKLFQAMGLKESISMFNLFAKCAQEVRNKRVAQEQERALHAQAIRFQQAELLREQRATEHKSRPRAFSHRPPATLAQCVTVWHKKQHGANGARYKKRLAAARELGPNKPKIKRVYKITDRDRELIKELNLRNSDFVQLDGHELQHVLHREFIGITRAISDTRTITVGSITGHDWTELLGAYLYTGMQVNKMGNCAQASQIADFCWTVTVGLGQIVLGVGEGIWQGGKNVGRMVRHPLDTGYGAACALGIMLIGCGDIIMAVGDPDLPIDHEYSTFQRARDPAQSEYLLHVYDTVISQAKQATPRDIARGVSAMATEAILTAKLSSAAVKCITSINSRVPGSLHRALSCAPETAESFALADGGHMRLSKGALQAFAESEVAEARAATLMRDGSVQGGKVLPPALNSKELAKKIGEDSEKILSYMKPHLDDLAKNGNKVKNIGDNVFKVAHTFSDKHIKNNILNVSKTVEQTAVECINVIKKADAANLLVEGVNNIHTFVNDIPLEIRLFIEEDTLMYFNGFVGHSARNVKHLVKIEGGAIWKAI
jgi:hypothetical protein